jgi:uncharacterized BrkB/YihY/UPF0761 family membrane protein
MNHAAEKIGQLLFPEKLRKFLTFRLMTVFVALLAVWSFVFSALDKAGHSTVEGGFTYSPTLLVLYNTILVVGFWLVYRTRDRKEYYWLRVIFYGMLLGSVGGEILIFVRRFLA